MNAPRSVVMHCPACGKQEDAVQRLEVITALKRELIGRVTNGIDIVEELARYQR